jgi:hypothetical protein
MLVSNEIQPSKFNNNSMLQKEKSPGENGEKNTGA